METNLDWIKLKDSESFHDQQRALIFVASLPSIDIQEPLILWFRDSNSIEIKKGILHLTIGVDDIIDLNFKKYSII